MSHYLKRVSKTILHIRTAATILVKGPQHHHPKSLENSKSNKNTSRTHTIYTKETGPPSRETNTQHTAYKKLINQMTSLALVRDRW